MAVFREATAMFYFKFCGMFFHRVCLQFSPATILLLLIFTLPSQAQYDSAQVKLWKEISQNKRAKDTSSLATSYHQLAMIKQFGIEQDSALFYLLKMRELFVLRRDTNQTNQTNTLIGHWYIGNGSPDEALRYFRDACRYFKTKRDTILIAHSLANIALAFEKLNQNDSSIIYRNRSLPLAYQIKDSFLIMIDLWSLSELARDEGNYHEALTLADESIRWSEMNEKNHLHYAAIVFNKAEILWLQKKYAQALQVYQQSLQAVPADQNPELRSNTYLRLSDCYEHLGQFDKALANQKLHQQINEQLLNEKRQKSIEQLRIQFETENKEKEISFLSRDNALIKRDAEKKKRFYLTLSVVLIALVGISMLAYFFNRKRLKAYRLIHLQSERIHEQRLTEIEQQHRIDSMKQILKGQEEERARIARDLHDSLGGILSGIKMHFQKLKSTITLQQDDSLANRTSQLINEACESVRIISHNIMPDALSKFGLTDALNDLVERSSASGIEIMLHLFESSERLDKEKETAIYYIVEEALNNIIRHSHATEVFIHLVRENSTLKLSIEDNGIGFDQQKVSADGQGLKNLRSRTSLLNGAMTIESFPGKGTLLIVTVPD